MVSPLVAVYHGLIGDKPAATTTAAPAATPAAAPTTQQAQGSRTGISAAGPSFLANAAAANQNQLSGSKSLMGQ